MRASGIIHPFLLLASLALGWAGFAVAINALVKTNHLKSFVKSNSPSGVTIDINVKDAYDSGAVLGVGCALLGLAALFSLVRHLLSLRSSSAATSSKRRSNVISASIYFFIALWILASLIAFDVIARNHSAKITASLGGQQLPQSAIQAQEQAQGVSPKYWDQQYIKVVAILPWFTFASAILSGFSLLSHRSYMNERKSRSPLMTETSGKRNMNQVENGSDVESPTSDVKH